VGTRSPLLLHHRSHQRPERSHEPRHREAPAQRPRHPQLRELSAPAFAPLRRAMEHSTNCSNQGPSPTPQRVEPHLLRLWPSALRERLSGRRRRRRSSLRSFRSCSHWLRPPRSVSRCHAPQSGQHPVRHVDRLGQRCWSVLVRHVDGDSPGSRRNGWRSLGPCSLTVHIMPGSSSEPFIGNNVGLRHARASEPGTCASVIKVPFTRTSSPCLVVHSVTDCGGTPRTGTTASHR
jgi:hypothetical protein